MLVSDSLEKRNVASPEWALAQRVVASPELIRVRCRSPRQMQLANGLARLLEFVEEDQARSAIPIEAPQVVTR